MMKCFRYACVSLFAVLVISGVKTLEGGEAKSGLAIGPSLLLIRNAPPGRAFTLKEVAKTTFHVINYTTHAGDYVVTSAIPGPAENMHSFEAGYETPPTAAWFTLDKRVVHLGPKEQADVDLKFDIPDKPEFYNRFWIVYVEVTPATPSGQVVGTSLKLRARVMLETKVKIGIGEALSLTGPIGRDPGTMTMAATGADNTWKGSTRVRNNTAQAATYDILPLDQVTPDAAKRVRYFSNPEFATRMIWNCPTETSITLAPGEERDVIFTAQPNQAITADKTIEEVVLIARRAAPGIDPAVPRDFNGKPYDIAGMVRLSYPAPVPVTPAVAPAPVAPVVPAPTPMPAPAVAPDSPKPPAPSTGGASAR